jgi:alcohol dehydrogenase class IV
MRFEFATAARIIFGPGSLRELAGVVAPLGKRALLVTGRDPARARPALGAMTERGIEVVPFGISGEPTVALVNQGVVLARQERADFIVAFGGGSAIDAGKAIGGLVGNGGDLLDYLEVVGRAMPLTRPSLPVVAIPTTSGTGCEVTKNAVLASPQHRVKVSLRSPFLLPCVALVDPELTADLPRLITAATGLDALTQLIEPFVSVRANPLTDALCTEGMRRVARSLRRACEMPGDLSAREDMAMASLFSGLALANSGLGAVHGFAAPIGGMFPAAHGAVCAVLLPHVMEVNLQALRARLPEGPALGRYREVGAILTGRAGAGTDDALSWVSDLCAALEIPPLRTYGLTKEDVAAVAQKAALASSMKGNPIALLPEELKEILLRAL